jgi:periplasmic divalent cation tolerance protein
MTSAIVVLVTAPDARVAKRLAEALVGERLAACVTALPGASSTYRWKGKIERAKETVLLIKTRKSLAKRLERRVRELHPYEVPEFLVIPVAAGSRGYLDWIGDSTRS